MRDFASKIILFGNGVVLLFALFCSSSVQAQWQQSISPQVMLGIRDKWAEESFVAEFLVALPNGKTESAKIQIDKDDFGYVLYPNHFNGGFLPGKYTWSARVNGKVVTRGQFLFEQDGSGWRVSGKN